MPLQLGRDSFSFLGDAPIIRLCRLRQIALELLDAGFADAELVEPQPGYPSHEYCWVGPRRGEPFDPYAYVISANIHRRHLNAKDRQDLLIELIARSPEKSDRQLGKAIGVDHKTIGRARAKGEDVGRIPHVETRIDTQGREQPAHRTANPVVAAEVDTETAREACDPTPPRRVDKRLERFADAIGYIFNTTEICCELTIPPNLTAETAASHLGQIREAIANLHKLEAKVLEVVGGWGGIQ